VIERDAGKPVVSPSREEGRKETVGPSFNISELNEGRRAENAVVVPLW
jgi:hypothetical protein